DIPIFFGNLEEDVDDFLANFRMVCRILGKRDDIEKGDFLLLCLRGNAEQWFWSISSQIEDGYTQISKALKTRFSKFPTTEKAWASLERLQQHGEDYYAYDDIFSRQWGGCRFSSTFPDYVKMEQFISGLSPFLKTKVTCSGPSTFEEAVTIARRKFHKYFYIKNGFHPVGRTNHHESVSIKESSPLPYLSPSTPTNVEEVTYMPTDYSSAKVCGQDSNVESLSSTFITSMQKLTQDISNGIDDSIMDTSNLLAEDQFLVRADESFVQHDSMENEDL
ncbi:hypothetical protein, partial [Enterobacter cloacae complex sp. GF14B]|uniref:hypothetical protein n=1 Tax=Enterobacter cloacae complex sp. GF14B TaxID=2511982 RepID=UPI0010281916